MKKTTFMGTTEVPVEKTCAEVHSLLVQSGARQIMTDYDATCKPIGVAFFLVVNLLPVSFKLPVRVDPVFKTINGGRSYNRGAYAKLDREQAERVAWRQLFRWLQAQLAMIQTHMVQAEEVFLPYMQEPSGKTLFEVITEQRFKALPPGESA